MPFGRPVSVASSYAREGQNGLCFHGRMNGNVEGSLGTADPLHASVSAIRSSSSRANHCDDDGAPSGLCGNVAPVYPGERRRSAGRLGACPRLTLKFSRERIK